ncbi:hypothetical protein COU78_00940 [Candidatus Peregrinibacteria bacterium CG10_big_fil_rev_8_21_14_0_10_49_24]|nr:MAG: hypothetical protein COV83_01190 [Candidatus Peregrinibacteria bacterium CG11_big_fil_rev_8_21_14_0_20_49_14]PIR51515.1 MAG: hypothetical protein COU78_00940 [Candidatus Peregrinibacteria bacterium CG10_big_fil_rev_8_21_14_0_10_49_24]PJA67842.1 MAG: hypothetical protein CO157_02400 [Candidatus Peregrinibacteria bacterium CG_4_9_14_3_um_filter_49_12]
MRLAALEPLADRRALGAFAVISEEVAMPACRTADRDPANGAKISRDFHDGRKLKSQTALAQTDAAVSVAMLMTAASFSPVALAFGHGESSCLGQKPVSLSPTLGSTLPKVRSFVALQCCE